MKKLISLAIMAGISLLIAGVDRSASANTQDQLLTGILNKMEKAHQDLKSLKAEMVLERTNTQIGVTDSEFGQLLYKPGPQKSKQKLRIDYTKPSKDVLAVDGDNFVFYQPRIKQALKGMASKYSKGRQGGLAQFITIALDGSLKSASGKYNIGFVKDEMVEGVMTSVLRLTPKSNDQFTSFDIWVNQQSGFPVRFSGTERNGDLTMVTLKNLQLNTNVPNNAFALDLPSGTKIVK
ncbi:MAG TPA: outer membrane lipoprotein carrier protein LolA [Blastocatellia bacterium]|nr:outer membrane lipoprotein carrier protein LolA [Blastocatellia bacterium]